MLAKILKSMLKAVSDMRQCNNCKYIMTKNQVSVYTYCFKKKKNIEYGVNELKKCKDFQKEK